MYFILIPYEFTKLLQLMILGRNLTAREAAIILDGYENTSPVGCVIALHKYHNGLNSGDKAVLFSWSGY